jgi:hypothetical protein
VTAFSSSLASVTAASITISNGGLTAASGTNAAAFKTARAIPPKLAQTFPAYMEFNIVAANATTGNDMVALEFSAAVMGVAVDLTNKLAWFTVNGVSWNSTGSPTLGTGGYSFSVTGPYFIAISCLSNGNPATVNFGNVRTTFTPPTGFSVWGADTLAAVTSSSNITIGSDGISAYPTASGWYCAFSTASKASGKIYFEVQMAQAVGNGFMIGLGNASANNANYLGSNGNSWGWQVTGDVYGLTGSGAPAVSGIPSVENNTGWANELFYYSDGVVANGTGTFASWTTGSVVCLAYRPLSNGIWWRVGSGNWNGSGTPNPATNTGAIAVPIGTARLAVNFLDSGSEITLNTAGPFAETVPAGFSAWDSSGVIIHRSLGLGPRGLPSLQSLAAPYRALGTPLLLG